MVKKNKLEKIENLDWICQQAKHLLNVYLDERKKFQKQSVERLFFEKIAGYYNSVAHGACSLFELATEVSQTEYLPREMVEIEDYKKWIQQEASTT
jgi:hypothetical protein